MSPAAIETLAAARRLAMNLLARREHSVGELRTKLARRGVDAGLLEDVIRGLQADELVSDARFAESLVRSELDRGKGPLRIRHALARREVDQAVIEATLAAAQPDWVRIARAARRKRFGGALPEAYPEQARQARFLQQRGFTGEQIRAALERDPT